LNDLIKNNVGNIVLKNIEGQCINETELQTFNFGANINICEAPQRFQYIHVTCKHKKTEPTVEN